MSHRKSYDSRIKIAIKLKEFVQEFVVSHEKHVLSVKPNVKSSTKSTNDTKLRKEIRNKITNSKVKSHPIIANAKSS